MSDQDTIFNTDTTNQNNTSSNNLSDKVSELVGEGKKYATEAEALNALVHAQTHISTIETENQTLREKLDNAKKVEDVLSKLDAQVDNATTNTQQEVDPVDIDALLEEKLTLREKQAVQINNKNSVNSKMVEMFGDKAQDQMLTKANELGMTVEQMQATAENSPNAFLAWFKAPVTQTNQQSIDSEINTTDFQSNEEVKVDTYAYFEKMRKENPTQYYDPKTQYRMTQLSGNPEFMG
jgi:hypothetical protein